jgi:hypothetical protein
MGYDIDSLIQRFESHAIEAERQAKERDEKFPDREKFFDDGFSLPRALMSICQEIRSLKDDNDTPKDQEVAGA